MLHVATLMHMLFIVWLACCICFLASLFIVLRVYCLLLFKISSISFLGMNYFADLELID